MRVSRGEGYWKGAVQYRGFNNLNRVVQMIKYPERGVGYDPLGKSQILNPQTTKPLQVVTVGRKPSIGCS